MSNRSARAGDTIKLRILIKNELGDPAQASNVYVHIFEPNTDYTDLAEAVTVSGIPTYLGQGIFEYEYTTPNCGPNGSWHDVWVGELTCQTLSGVNTFNVTASGMTQALDHQLFNNDIVQVTLTSGIRALDGTYLSNEFNMEFLTTTSPSYTNIRKVRMEVGAFVNQLPDDIIQLGILEASIEADMLTFSPSVTNLPLFQHARREYVTCATAGMLLTNVGSLLLRSKSLADLQVSYDTNGVRDAMSKILDCMNKWEIQVIAGGGARAGTQPKGVVKGEFDIDRPTVSRSWESTESFNSDTAVPAANTRTDNPHRRRQQTTYVSRFSRGKKGRNW